MVFKAKTLDEAYKKASSTFDCSIVDLEIEVVQNPSSGFLGMFAKEAIIKVLNRGEQKDKTQKSPENKPQKTLKSGETSKEIKQKLQKLLDASCYELDVIEVKEGDEEIFIKLDGKDAALMIGKEGYRYKAISYILHNWLKMKYNKTLSLEIAEFLKNQKENVLNYLEGTKQRVSEQGRAQTKPLDGILVKIALEELRRVYPDMYVAIKTLRDGRKVVVVNEHRK